MNMVQAVWNGAVIAESDKTVWIGVEKGPR